MTMAPGESAEDLARVRRRRPRSSGSTKWTRSAPATASAAWRRAAPSASSARALASVRFQTATAVRGLRKAPDHAGARAARSREVRLFHHGSSSCLAWRRIVAVASLVREQSCESLSILSSLDLLVAVAVAASARSGGAPAGARVPLPSWSRSLRGPDSRREGHVDGSRRAESADRRRAGGLRRACPPGPYRFRFERDGFVPFEKRAGRPRHAPIDVKVTLTPAPPPPEPPPAPVAPPPPPRPRRRQARRPRHAGVHREELRRPRQAR